ncbi:MFS transporter [Sphingomonas naphthae]|uniref:MFS transporter n=1 Tax=Sphingomonas naphthae TaxID=1813468 RepID=A0ABY7TN17_9SPHN|nr:MFS transporter [Sphingomonas naphthae]WCT74584.1 MFS transporter [Sphingomonas naphthae]
MTPSFHLLSKRRFLPLFTTQFLGAFNDNLFRTAMVMLVTFRVYSDPKAEALFSAIAAGLFILPFFLLSAPSGQLADGTDKARIVRLVKTAEILIMIVGAAGLLLAQVPLLLAALFAMGVHSTFFGPIKYAILPQHLHEDEVLGGTGLVEGGTYCAILLGTIVGGVLPAEYAAGLVIVVALIGRLAGSQVPPAPAQGAVPRVDWNVIRSSIRLVGDTMHIRHLFLAIAAISFFWAMGAILAAQFPPLVKNVFGADQDVATLFLSVFSVGVALGSVAINRLLKGTVQARFAPAAALGMGAFVLMLYWTTSRWVAPAGEGTLDLHRFLAQPMGVWVLVALLGVAVAGGMFVVPLYAFLTTSVPKAETARTVAANNIVNSGAMVASTLILSGLIRAGVGVSDTLFLVAVGSVGAAWLGWRLHCACDPA